MIADRPSLEEGSKMQEIYMAGYINEGAPNVGKDVQVKGSITSEDSGFYLMVISAIIFLIAALSGNLA